MAWLIGIAWFLSLVAVGYGCYWWGNGGKKKVMDNLEEKYKAKEKELKEKWEQEKAELVKKAEDALKGV